MDLLSAKNRSGIIDKLESTTYDLTIIGGGITGAGIALDAASRGLKVALLEKQDFASGTSSKSTKLIHGGLRYLKQFEIALVREVGRERATVHRLAPHLVTAEKMLLPLIEGGTYGRLATSLGLKVYDLLAGVKGDDRRRMLSKKATMQKEPMVRTDVLLGGGYYAEYRTDDARLTIENIKTAVDHGAVCLNYAKAQDFIYKDGKVVGVHCKDLRADTDFSISSEYVVSAAGPWVDKLRKIDSSLQGKHLFLSKGVHIVVPHERFPLKQSVYFDVPDGRMLFAIPRHRTTYIGTTDTPYNGDLNHVLTNQEDVDYLIEATNSMFPDLNLTTDDVESSWAGLRPLIHEEGKSASEMSRKDEIFESDTGLISIAGGKLTGYRKMAERIVNLVADKFKAEHGRILPACRTQKIPLTGGPFKNASEVDAYRKEVENKVKSIGLDAYHAIYLVANYGKQTDDILDHMPHVEGDTTTRLARAELQFTIENELVATPMDFFERRTGRLYFNLPSIKPLLDTILDDFQNYFNWDTTLREQEKEKMKVAIEEVSQFQYSKELA